MTHPTPTSPLPLRPYQIADLSFLIQQKRALLLHDPGGGKTPPVCVFLWYLWSSEGRKTLWVMPDQLKQKNVDELLRFTHFKREDVLVLSGAPEELAAAKVMDAAVAGKLRQAQDGSYWSDLGDVPARQSKARVEGLIRKQFLTPELAPTKKGMTADFRAALKFDAKVIILGADLLCDHWPWLLQYNPEIDALVGDEVHMYWNTHESLRTQAMYSVARRVTYWVGMTGTLIKGRLSSAYPAIQAIDPNYYVSYGAFIGHHAVKDSFGKIIAWVNADRISKICGQVALKRSFESIYGKEAKVIVTEACDMTPAQRSAYEEFEAKAIVELEDSFLEAKTGGVFTLRCRQIMAHPETFGLGDADGHTGKDKQLLVHLADHHQSGEPLILFAAFKAEQDRLVKLVKAHKMSVALLNGDTPSKQRAIIDQQFRSKKVQVLVGSPQVATVGFNWEHCDHIIFTTLDAGDDTFVQAYRRAIRGVRTKPLLITVLEYRKSIDQRWMGLIEKKSRLANKVDAEKDIYKLSVA